MFRSPTTLSDSLRNALILAVVATRCWANSDTSLSHASPGEEHSIFLGIRILVEIDGKEQSVVHFEKNTLFALEDSELIPVPASRDSFIKKTIKHSDRYLEIHDLKAEPRSSKLLALGQTYAENLSYMSQTQTKINMISSGMDPSFSPLFRDSNASMGSSSDSNAMLTDSLQTLDSLNSNLDVIQEQMSEATRKFDRLSITFSLQPDFDFKPGFLLVRLIYVNPQEKDEDRIEANLVRVFELEAVPAGERRRYYFLLSGFPEGPVIQNMEYHFFSAGREVATSYSHQRLELEEEEAFDFLYADYVSQSGLREADPSLFRPVPAPLPLRDLVVPPYADTSLRIPVDSMGYAETDQVDLSAVPPRFHPDIREILQAARFFPALREGIPTPSEIELKLATLMAAK